MKISSGTTITLLLLVILCLVLIHNQPQKQTASFKEKKTDITVKKAPPKKKLIIVPVEIVHYPPKPKPQPMKTKVSRPKKQQQAKPAPAPLPAKSSKGNSGNSGDSDPAILASYGMPIQSYLQFMAGQGAQIALYNTTKGRFMCAVTSAGKLGNSVDHSGMSPRARRITNDFPNADALISKARQRFGKASYEILLLIPQNMDDRLHRNIQQIIGESGRNSKDVSMVQITYTGSAGSVKVSVNTLKGSGGNTKINKTFYL